MRALTAIQFRQSGIMSNVTICLFPSFIKENHTEGLPVCHEYLP